MRPRVGAYVVVELDGARERGIVRRVSDDGRIAYVEVEGEVDLYRFSPDELSDS